MEILRDELNVTAFALNEAMQILELISGRNFSADEMDLQQYQELTITATSLAMRLWDAIVIISSQARDWRVCMKGVAKGVMADL